MSQEALMPFKNEEIMNHQKDMKEQFFKELESLENGTRDFLGEINVTAIYIRLLEELGEIDEAYTTHLKEKMRTPFRFSLKNQEQ